MQMIVNENNDFSNQLERKLHNIQKRAEKLWIRMLCNRIQASVASMRCGFAIEPTSPLDINLYRPFVIVFGIAIAIHKIFL